MLNVYRNISYVNYYDYSGVVNIKNNHISTFTRNNINFVKSTCVILIITNIENPRLSSSSVNESSYTNETPSKLVVKKHEEQFVL